MKNGRYSSRFFEGLRPSEGETTGAGAPRPRRLDGNDICSASRRSSTKPEVREIFRFDRVLCDVSRNLRDEKTIKNDEKTRNLFH